MVVSFKSEIKNLQNYIKGADRKARTAAAKYLVKKLKEKAKKHKKTGNLVKGIGYVNYKDVTKVGVGPPAYHAHLLEFGTSNRYTKDNAYRGRILPTPFIIPTFLEEVDKVEKIIIEEFNKNV